jgi:hypothetical protein
MEVQMIEKLTDEQLKSTKTYYEKWIKIGFNTDRFNLNEATPIIHNIYREILKQSPPNQIKIFDSPFLLWKYVQEEIGVKISFLYPYFAGSFDASVFSFYDFMFNIGVKIDNNLMKKYRIWESTIKLGLIYTFDDVCLITQKPSKIVRKNEIIHCDNGPAIEYADGFCVYMLNGVRVPKEYVITPWNELNPQLVVKETNAEVRRELVRKIGIERVIEKLGADVIDKNGEYELLSLNIGSSKRPYLKMKNPSIGVYHIEGVPPNTKTVKDALIFRNGTDEKPIVLT